MTNDSPNALNYLEPYKWLSLRIAKAWRDGEALPTDQEDEEGRREFLVNEGFFSSEEVGLFEIEEAESENDVLIDLTTFKIKVRFRTPDIKNTDPAKYEEELEYFLSNNPDIGSYPNLSDSDLKIFNTKPWGFGQPRISFVDPFFYPLKSKLFNVLQPSKELSQLIAKTWLPEDKRDEEARDIFTRAASTGGSSEEVKGLLKRRNLLSEFDAGHSSINVVSTTCNPNSSGSGIVYVGSVSVEPDNAPGSPYLITIPYPEPSPNLISNPQVLEEWVNSPDGEPPYTPVGISPVDISRWIPLTC